MKHIDKTHQKAYNDRLTLLVMKLRSSRFFSHIENRRGVRLFSFGAVAVACTIFGILIASNVDLTPESNAQISTNIGQTGLFPVVGHGDDMQSPFVAVVEKAADAVVNISAETRRAEGPWWYYGTQTSTSLGSGFFFREDGYILTNNHVIRDAVEMTVRTAAGYEYQARLVGADPQTDLAVIKVTPEEQIEVIPFGNSDETKIGDWAIAIGNPFMKEGLDRTVTVGVVSAKGRSSLNFGSDTPGYQNYIQTDAAINPGNSGGPLLNLRGECIGVNAAITSPTGTSVGIGFAIPINLARAVVPDLIENGRPSRGWLGVRMSKLTEKEAKRLGLEAVRGVVVESIVDNSPAQRAGLQHGDIVVGFDNKEVKNENQFSVLVSSVRQGEIVPMEVIRDGEHLSLKAMIGDRDTFLATIDEQNQQAPDRSGFWLGMEVIEFTPRIAEDIGAEHVAGLYVVGIYPGSAADRASIAEGTIIMKVDNEPVGTLSELEGAVDAIDRGKSRIPLIVQEPDGSIARKVIRK
ncbi:MAG: peptidase [Candidatus Zixiibacteriota bacterium]|nr:MAG: peptidase [candidate division Zixibacteria bacterium]